MKHEGEPPAHLEQLLDNAQLADALESDRFKRFLDHIPFAVVVSELPAPERIVYANLEFERLTGQTAQGVVGQSWDAIKAIAAAEGGGRKLSKAIAEGEDYLGVFKTLQEDGAISIDAWSNIIQDDNGKPTFRLLALAEISERDLAALEELEQRIKERDLLLRELQHRVKNNLQMITALIRLEARNLPQDATAGFNRLAGRINALALLYRSLSASEPSESVDLGVYLSQIASAVMQAHAVEGIRLDLKVDTWPVSVNVAMPAGLVVNELLTNALKHAFKGRERGTVTLQSLADETGCRVTVADDGNGLAEGAEWPRKGHLGSLMVQSLEENAHARVEVASSPGKGMRVSILFARADAAPESA